MHIYVLKGLVFQVKQLDKATILVLPSYRYHEIAILLLYIPGANLTTKRHLLLRRPRSIGSNCFRGGQGI